MSLNYFLFAIVIDIARHNFCNFLVFSHAYTKKKLFDKKIYELRINIINNFA